MQEALRNATIESIIGMVLGGLPPAMGGGGGAGILVGPGAATQSMLQYTRTMEASADAAAMGFLDKHPSILARPAGVLPGSCSRWSTPSMGSKTPIRTTIR